MALGRHKSSFFFKVNFVPKAYNITDDIIGILADIHLFAKFTKICYRFHLQFSSKQGLWPGGFDFGVPTLHVTPQLHIKLWSGS